MQEYRRQMQQEVIPAAYKGLMKYMLALRAHFAKRHPYFLVSGSIYQGYMEMTFFTCMPGLNVCRACFLLNCLTFKPWLLILNRIKPRCGCRLTVRWSENKQVAGNRVHTPNRLFSESAAAAITFPSFPWELHHE